MLLWVKVSYRAQSICNVKQMAIIALPEINHKQEASLRWARLWAQGVKTFDSQEVLQPCPDTQPKWQMREDRSSLVDESEGTEHTDSKQVTSTTTKLLKVCIWCGSSKLVGYTHCAKIRLIYMFIFLGQSWDHKRAACTYESYFKRLWKTPNSPRYRQETGTIFNHISFFY